jgi:alpha-tubulin suppressor-like RCC1 family protein
LGLGHTNLISTPGVIPGHKDIVGISAGFFHSMILNSQGKVYCFGYNLVRIKNIHLSMGN